MRKKKSAKTITGYVIIVAIIALVCWDFTTSINDTVETGTYRLESDFDAITAATTLTKVAVVSSDYTGLTNPVSKKDSLSYGEIEDMVRKAIELQGGLDGIINKGDKVMIKPNIVELNTPPGDGTNTDVRVVKALIKIIDEFCAGDVQITIAEGCPRMGYDDPASSNSVWETSGYRALLADPYLSGVNFSLFNLNQPYTDLRKVDLKDAGGNSAPQDYTYYIHKKELEADVYITVPVLKIHDTGITCALKNQIGTAPGAYYGYNKKAGTSYCPDGLVHDAGHRRWTTEAIVDLSKIANIKFVVVDAVHILESVKTNMGGINLIRFNTVIAGSDPVAVDNVCARLLYLNPDDIAHITLAEKTGLGTNNQDYIDVVGSSIADTRLKVQKNQSENGKWGQSNRTWLLSKTYSATDVTSPAIENEATYIPKAGKDGWSQPTYFFDDRIDLLSYYNDPNGVVSYAFTYFDSPSDMTAELWLGYDEGIIVYLNGLEVYKFTSSTIYSEGDIGKEKADIQLKKGVNTLLVKTYQEFNDYSFALNICEKTNDYDLNGNRVEGLKFYTWDSVTTTHTNNEIANNGFTAFPNPCTTNLNITLSLSKTLDGTIVLYDINGRFVANIKSGTFHAGKNVVQWNLNNSNNARVNPGIYICVLKAGGFQKSKRIIVE